MSTDEYVPSEDDMRHAYWLTRMLDHHADVNAAFDRFLARVRRDAAEQRIRDLTQEARDERGAARDQMEQVRIRDERIQAVRDVLDRHSHYGLVEADDIRRALEG